MSDNPKAAAKIDQLAEFHRLKEETAVINAKMRASAPLLNSSVSSSDALLGIILKELKAMRVEVKEVKEDVERIEENQKKMQEDVAEKFGEMKEAQKQFAEDQKTITLNQKSHEEKLIQIQEDVASSKQKSQNSDVNDIKQAIFGKWRNINNPFIYFSAKFEGDKFFIRWLKKAVEEYTLGVKHSKGWTVTVENDKIVQKRIFADGAKNYRDEYYIEDEKLVWDFYEPGNSFWKKDVYERVGDPDFA